MISFVTLTIYITRRIDNRINCEKVPIFKVTHNTLIISRQNYSLSNALISSKAVLTRGTFFLQEHKWTIARNISSWNVGDFPGNPPLIANIRFNRSLPLVYPSCNIYVHRPSLFFNFIYWPQHGHTLFNVIANIYQTMKETNIEFCRIRLYGGIDNKKTITNLTKETVDVDKYTPLFRALSDEPVYNYYSLIKTSMSHTICFTNSIIIGTSKKLDHYTKGIDPKEWQVFSQWILNIINLPTKIRNTDVSSLEKQIVLTLIDRSSRKITNLVQLKQKTEKIYGYSITVQIVDLANISFSEQLKYMRNTTILFGIDGTGLMSSLFMLNACGFVIHIGTYKMRTLVPHKGDNFISLMEAGTGQYRYIYSEIKHLKDVDILQREKLRNISFLNMTAGERWKMALKQNVHLPIDQYLKLLGQAMNMVQTCLNQLILNSEGSTRN